jgi:hypothetical protein
MKLETVFEKVRSDAERVIVLYLREVGSATTEQMEAKFGWQRIKTISVLRNLEHRGILTELEASSRERFALISS